MNRNNIDVAITYSWNRVAYNVLRSLSSRGLEVAVGDENGLAMAKKSKFCHCRFSYPCFYNDPRAFIEYLKTIIQSLKPNVYLPLHEEIFIVAKYIDEFKGLNIKIPIHDFITLKSVHKKDSFTEIALKLGLPVPRTIKPNSTHELENIWNQLGSAGKVVIKSINSNSSKGIFYATSFKGLKTIFQSLIDDKKLSVEQYPIMQEYVSGAGYGVSMLFNHGQLRAKFIHKRLRAKIATGGTSTKRISTRNQLIEDYAEKLLTSLNWHGVAMVEFIVNEVTGQAWIIEVNPRFWGSLALAIQSGVDFPYLLYRMAIDGDVAPILKYKEGVTTRWLLGDILATISSVKATKSLRPIFQFFDFRNESYDDFYWDDSWPFFIQGAYYLNKFIRTASVNPTENALLDVDKI